MANSVDQKLLKQTKFPPEFNQKVDMQKVNIEVMKRWIAGKISEILGDEDDVVIELCFNLLEGSRFPSIKVLQIQLTGFLDKDTAAFCKELWTLCLSAQANPQGVPKELLEAKKLELIQEKIAAEKASEEARRRREQERTREREIEDIRQRERGERSGRGRGSFRGGRGGRDFDRRRRDSRSPPTRRDAYNPRGPPPRRDIDTYIPSEGRRRHEIPRRRSPNSSRSISPRRRYHRARSPSSSRSASPAGQRRRSISENRSFSATPPRRIRRDSSSPDRSRSGSRRHVRRRMRSPEALPKRGDHRARRASIERPRSRSPRSHRNGRRISPSLPSQSPSPPRHRRRRQSYSRSRSPTSRHRSISLPRNKRERRLSRDRRSPSGDEDRKLQSPYADARKERNHDRKESRHSSRDRSGSPRARKRRRSIERYDPRSKRRRNSSSPDEEAATPSRNEGSETGSEQEVGSDS